MDGRRTRVHGRYRETQGGHSHCARLRHRSRHNHNAQGLPLVGGQRQSGAHALVPNGGDVVIRVDGTVLGALDVSGAASSITDHRIGAAAIAESG
ncbi:heme-binding protein [Nocardia anaemiae]|uniref:heme-binding protein n=1 Tax=Nocardia anaemiae TaxID=263910 RepID=UPI0012F489E6